MTAFRILAISCLTWGLIAVPSGHAQQSQLPTSPATPAELVATYDSLATAILAAKKAEENVVRTILSTSYAHANAALARARQAMESGNSEAAGQAIEQVAAHVAQLGSEGDNAVAAVRKRLVEGGHHHHAAAENEGIFDAGFVVVTKEAKRQLLDASREIAQLARSPNAQGLTQAWDKVQTVWNNLAKNN